jgi:hypothetical protein
MPRDFKGTVFPKIRWWVKYWPRINIKQFTNINFGYWFFIKKFCSLSIWRICRKAEKNEVKLSSEHISFNNGQTWKNCRFFPSLLDKLD